MRAAPYLLCMPALVLFAGIVIVPLAMTVLLSFHDCGQYKGIERVFILKNWHEVLTGIAVMTNGNTEIGLQRRPAVLAHGGKTMMHFDIGGAQIGGESTGAPIDRNERIGLFTACS